MMLTSVHTPDCVAAAITVQFIKLKSQQSVEYKACHRLVYDLVDFRHLR